MVKKSLTNCFTGDHVFMLKGLMEHYDYLKKAIERLEGRLEELLKPYAHLLEKLDEIPGIDKRLAQTILAETTDEMENFKNERAFAAWSGVASGNNESAGKKKEQNAGTATPI